MRSAVRANLLYLSLRLGKSLDRRRPSASELGTERIARILLVSCTALGDTLMSTPAIRSIRMAYPGARISLLLHPSYLELFRDLPGVDEIIPYRGGWRGFIATAMALRRRGYDLACILHGNEPQATPLAYLSGARFIFKLPNDSRFGFLLSNPPDVPAEPQARHVIDKRLAIARLAGGLPTDHRMELPLSAASGAAARAWLRGEGVDIERQRLIGFQIGASEAHRCWPMDRFAGLARRILAADGDLRIVLTGSPPERKACAELFRQISDSRVLIAAGMLPLAVVAALVKQFTVLVTGDTGPMHIAIAVGTPVIALFASADSRRTGPSYDLDRHTVIQKWKTCDPCLGSRCPYNPAVCMENISVDEVHAAVLRYLAPA